MLLNMPVIVLMTLVLFENTMSPYFFTCKKNILDIQAKVKNKNKSKNPGSTETTKRKIPTEQVNELLDNM